VRQKAILAGLCVSLFGLAVSDYLGYRELKKAHARLNALSDELHQTGELARREADAAMLAGQRADDAARQAEVAATGRQHAESLKSQSEIVRDQALNMAQRATEQTKQAQNELVQMRQEREKELDNMQQALSKVVETRRTATGMVMILPEATFRFGFDDAQLTPKNREVLSRIAGILLASKGYGLAVYGYTDDVGSAEYNQQLSERRAKAVEEYLAQAGVDAGTIGVKGFGKTNPIAKGTSQEARAKNRRVEIALTDSEIKYQGEAAQ
jgi:outer membrane protein OmpA-like peptidoglycan-associated protein